VVQGSKALVSLTGTLCIGVEPLSSSTACSSNSSPAYRMPQRAADCTSAYQAATATQQLFTPVPCQLVRGTWYVDIGSGS